MPSNIRQIRGPTPQHPKVLSVTEAGKRYFGICRNASYDAAKRGDIPTIRIGKLILVPIAAMEQMLAAASLAPLEAQAERRRIAREKLRAKAKQLRDRLTDIERQLAS